MFPPIKVEVGDILASEKQQLKSLRNGTTVGTGVLSMTSHSGRTVANVGIHGFSPESAVEKVE